MWNENDRKWLYETMSSNGVDTGSYEEFANSLNNKEDRDWYYNKSLDLGLDVGSAEDFYGMMVQPQQPKGGENGYTLTEDELNLDEEEPKKSRVRQKWEALKNDGNEEEEDDSGAITNPLTPKQVDEVAQRVRVEVGITPDVKKNATPNHDYGWNAKHQKQQSKKQQKVAANQRTEAVERVRTKFGSLDDASKVKTLESLFGKPINEIEQDFFAATDRRVNGDYDLLFTWATGGNLKANELNMEHLVDKSTIAGKSGYTPAQIEAGLADEKITMEYMVNKQMAELGDGLNTLEAEAKEKAAAEQAKWNEEKPALWDVAMSTTDQRGMTDVDAIQRLLSIEGVPTKEAQAIAGELNMINYTKQNIAKARNMQELAKTEGNGAQQFVSGMTAAFLDPDTWTSEYELKRGQALQGIINKMDDEGEGSLTPTEQKFLESVVLLTAYNEMYNKDISAATAAGKSFMGSIPFMFEMAINPLRGTGKVAGKKLAKWAMKRFSSKTMKKGALVTGKAIGNVAGSAVAGYGTAGTMQLGDTVAGVQERMQGDVVVDLDEDGHLVYGGQENEKDLPTAVYEETTERMLDTASEIVGAGYVSMPFRQLRKWGRGTRSLGWIDNLANSRFGRQLDNFLEKTGWHGPIEEFMEEVHVGLLSPALLEDSNLKDFFNEKDLTTTLIAVAVPGAITSSLSTAVGTFDGSFKLGAQEKWKMQNADRMARALWGDNIEQWNKIKSSLDNGSIENTEDTLSEVDRTIKAIYADNTLTNEQKKAALEYAVYSLQYKTATGVRDAMTVERKDALDDMFHEIYGTSFTERVSPAQANKSYKAFQAATAKAEKVLGLNGLSVEEWMNGRSVAEAADGNAKVAEVLTEYLSAKMDFEGKRDRFIHDRDRAYRESDMLVDDYSNNGMIYTTRIDNQDVYITGGNVVLHEDGVINWLESSEELYVRMPDGKVLPIAPMKLIDKVVAVSAESVKLEERAKIDANFKAEFDAAEVQEDQTASGSPVKTASNSADAFTLVDNGIAHTVEVVAPNNDGMTTSIMLDGEQKIIPNDLLNTWREAAGVSQTENGEVKTENQIEVAPVATTATTEMQTAPVAQAETVQPAPKTALEQIPRNEKNVPLYEQVDSELAWDGVVEEAGGNEEIAMVAVNSMIADKQDALKKAEKAKARAGATITEKIAAENERVANIEKAKADLAKWEEIAGVKAKRAAAQAENVAVPVVEETQAPVVESAPVAEVEIPQATNEMQPVEETNESTLSQTSDNVAEGGNAPDNGGVLLSDEVDENGRQFVLNSKGEIAFGEIAEDTGLTPAPILLSEGLITNPATNDGYGLVHIEARHGDQIRNAGYNSVVEFVEEVAKNYEVIREGKDRDGHQTYMLQLTDKHNNTLMVELSGDGTYWNINTAGIFKTSYGKNRKEVYNRHTTAKQSTETVEASQDTEQSGTQATSSMNAPTTSSASEDSNSVSNKQENTQKSDENAENGGENAVPEWLNKVPDDGRNFFVYVKFAGEDKYQAIDLGKGETVDRLVRATMLQKDQLQALVDKLPSVLLEDAEFQIRDAKGNIYYNSGKVAAQNEVAKQEDKDVAAFDKQAEIAKEREQRAGMAPRPGHLAVAIGEGNEKAVEEWKAKFDSYLQKLNADDLPAIDATIKGMQGRKKDILKMNKDGYKDNSNYKAYDYIETVLKKRAAELKKVSATEQPKQEKASQGERSKGKTESEPKQEVEKIEDVGEVLAGARKDALKVLASSFENATVKSLIELPFSKAFKKPDLKKAVESGALREEDALFYEAMFNALINSSKPKNSARHRNAVETWAEETYNSLQLIKSFVEADEAARDRAMAEALDDKFPARAEELAVIEKRKVWNARNNAEWGDKTTPNPVWVAHEVLKALGYKPGDKVEIPFGVLKANVFATGYEFYNKKGERLIMQSVPTVEEGIENIVWLSKIKRGDTDTMHPVSSFFATPTKRDMGDSGRYYVLWGTVRNPRRSEFGSIEEANAFAAGHKEAVVRPIQEVVKRYGYKLIFREPITGDKFFVNDMEFETEGEAMQYLEDNYDAVNEQTNELFAKERGETKKEVSADDLLEVAMVRGKEGWKYAVNIKGKYANNMGMPLLLREFDTREDAKAFLNESKNEVFEIYKKQQTEQKKFVFFDTGENSRIGEDYRGGRDVTAKDFMDTFGFRGVQFGNWTNQEDRQMAVNQAFDAFMDLAKLLGVSPKALSLNGELGMAFGSRGSGFGNAHYEPGEIVINLTKTRGAGSLAHEWWHALDNYFARRANVPMGMVTDSRSIDMRPELRQAYNELLKMIEKSDFYKRSKAKGDYWGRMHEVTARLMAEWVDQSLKDRGELNTFLSRGVNEERYKRMNYNVHRTVALIKGKEALSYEEFEKTPEALAGFPYPSRAELKEFGDAMRNIFETVEEQETEDGNVVLYSIAEDAMLQDRGTEAFERATKVTMEAVERLKANGLDIEVVSQEEADAMMELAEMQKRTAPETVSVQDEHLQTVVSSAGKRKSPETALPEDESSFKGTAISSDDGAKILKDIDSAIAKYENSNDRAETFIGNVAKALGIDAKDKSSKYATFEAKNGVIFTIRISNHNATVSNFDNTGEGNGISIVISRKPNEGITNDGNAHLVEFFYPEKKISKADGKPLVEILKSIKQALYSGEYKDNTGLAVREEVNIPEMMTVFHGSGAQFDRFDHSFMGSGEGNRVAGWGTYVTTNKETGISYAESVSRNSTGERYLYAVEIPDDNGSNYIHLDKYVSTSLKKRAKDKVRKILFNGEDADYWKRNEKIIEKEWESVERQDATGDDLRATMEELIGDAKEVSNIFSSLGFVGFKTETDSSAGTTYVIFNENDAQIKDRVEFLRTANGKVYGWAVDGKIRLTPDGINPNTPVHEYAHLWGADVEKNNPKLWNEVVEAMKLSPVWNEVANDANYSNIHGNDSRMASEVLSRLSGRENYRRTMEEAEKEIAAERDIVGKVQKKGILNRIKNALKNFWNWVQRNVFRSGKRKDESGQRSSEVMPWEEFANSVVGDFYKGKNPDVKESSLERMFIGKKGTENLDKAEEATTRLDNLGVAREMESAGKDAKAIKLATGWERGADGKWRYETEDVKLNRAAELFSLENHESYPIAESLDKGRVDFNGTIKLADLVNDEELFKAYPGMEKYFVSFEEMSANVKGEHDAENTMIRINKDDISELESTLVHEIQHAIQSAEGFAKGGSTSSSNGLIQEVLKTLHVDSNYPPSLSEVISAVENGYITRSQHEELVKIAQSHGYDDAVEYVRSLSPYSYYHRLAGEVESRNVEERMGMSPEERRNKLAEETEDVSREDQIFMYDNLGVSASEVAEGSIDDVKIQPLTFEEQITESLLNVSAENKENFALRASALRQLGQDLANVTKLMSKQREYDKSTVNQLVKLAKMYFKNAQLMGEVSTYAVGRVLAVINNVVGKKDIMTNATKLMDILLESHSNSLEGILEKAEKVKAKKVNAAGVEVMGSLDVYAQETVDTYKAHKDWDAEELSNAVSSSLDDLGEAEEKVRAALKLKPTDDVAGVVEGYETQEDSADDAVKNYKTARAIYKGMLLAEEYRENVHQAKKTIDSLKKELIKARGTMSKAAMHEFVKSTNETIMETRIELIDALHNLIYKFTEDVQGGRARAKAFVQAQVDRAREIQHNANSDMEGISADVQGKKSTKWNNSLMRGVMSSTPTFQTMLKKFGEKAVDGKGYLYERFIPQATMASEKEFRGQLAARVLIDTKLKELYGKKADIAKFAKDLNRSGINLRYTENGVEKTFDLTKGQMLYIYMANKMSDGKMKLRKMGITEEMVANIQEELPDAMVKFADWVQDELLADLRERYNKVHERMFGAPMAAIENYFPLKIKKEARGEKGDVSQQDTDNKPSTMTGSIIKRTKNSTALDLSADALAVLLEHIDQMEHWAAYAEFNRDLNTLLNYRHFQNQVKNMSSVRYGSGDTLWKNFQKVAQIASGTYQSRPQNEWDRAVLNLSKGIATSKIAFRGYTALKQLLSAPAFWNEAGITELAHCYGNPMGSWNWALENLPGFKKRWEGHTAGNEKFLKSESDWKLWHTKAVEKATEWGMKPNAFVDAVTVAVGARAVYETKLKQFKEAGYTVEKATQKALQAANEAYNESQQSSEGVYLSPIQADSTAASAAVTTFKNSNFGFTRKTLQAAANLKRKSQNDYKESSIEFMKKKLMRDGLSEEQAEKYAKKLYKKSLYKDVADLALFGFGLNLLWELGGAAIYLFLGDDDDEKEKMIEEAGWRAVTGVLAGMPGGDLLADGLKASLTGEWDYVRLPMLVAAGDIESFIETMRYDKVKAANDFVNMLVAAGVHVNPQTLTDVLVALFDGDGWDAEEIGLFAMRFLNAPQSQLDKLEVDKAMENSARDLTEVMKRYVEYKHNKATPLTGWMYSDENEQNALERYAKRFDKLLDERFDDVIAGDAATFDTFYNNATPEKKEDLADKRKAFLNKGKEKEFVKLSLDDIVNNVSNGETRNEVYSEYSTAEDIDSEIIINQKRTELKPVYDALLELPYSEKAAYRKENEKDIILYKKLKKKYSEINKLKKEMKDYPEGDNLERMNKIREKMRTALDLINNNEYE